MRRRTVFLSAWVMLWIAGAAWAEPRQEIHFPDLPGYRTLKCDLHMHTVFSDGVVWPTVRVDEAWRQGLDAIAITDHIEYHPHKDDVSTDLNRPYAVAAAAAQQKNILLIQGGEITRDTPPGHHNAIFLKDVNPLNTEDFYEVFHQAHLQQAFIFWNHPGWQGPERGRWGEAQDKLLENKWLHGIEVCNGESYYADAHRWAVEKNLTLMGDSDMHGPFLDTDWTPESHRTLTLVFARERTLPALHEALAAGRTTVWFRNQLIGTEPLLTAMFAACVQVHPAHHRDKNTVWVEIDNSCELNIELERLGGVGPAKLSLPARATALVKLPAPAGEASPSLSYSYRAVNFLVGPNKPLTVKLEVPPARASAPAPAAAK